MNRKGKDVYISASRVETAIANEGEGMCEESSVSELSESMNFSIIVLYYYYYYHYYYCIFCSCT
jgi:hypothetical protein